jgi:hypothetical protein
MNRPRTQTLLAASALGLALVAVPALPAVAGDDGPTVTTSGSTKTIKVHEQQTTDQFAPKGEEPGDWPEDENFIPKVGDAFVFTADLSQGGKKVGTDAGRCTATEVQEEPFSITNACAGTLTFPGGTLLAKGPLIFSEDAGPNFEVPLVSGTGAYSGARGMVHGVDNDCGEDCELSSSELTLMFTTDGSQVSHVPTGGAATGGGVAGNSSDAALLIGIGGIAALAGFGVLAGGRRLAVTRREG